MQEFSFYYLRVHLCQNILWHISICFERKKKTKHDEATRKMLNCGLPPLPQLHKLWKVFMSRKFAKHFFITKLHWNSFTNLYLFWGGRKSNHLSHICIAPSSDIQLSSQQPWEVANPKAKQCIKWGFEAASLQIKSDALPTRHCFNTHSKQWLPTLVQSVY